MFTLERIAVPPRPDSLFGEDIDADRVLFGDQYDCGFNNPLLFRALSNGGHRSLFVKAPDRTTGGHDVEFVNARCYWVSLVLLLVHVLGWRDPRRGLGNWIRLGMPTDSPALALMKEVWVEDGQFDAFCAWAWSSGYANSICNRQFSERSDSPDSMIDDLSGEYCDDSWVDGVRARFEASRVPNPLTGGGDPLHLNAHVDFASGELPKGVRPSDLSVKDDGRSADLVVYSMTGWYRELVTYGGRLAHPEPSRSVRVTVHCPHVGTLGEFRRSRDTGLWFSGKHSSHMLGN